VPARVHGQIPDAGMSHVHSQAYAVCRASDRSETDLLTPQKSLTLPQPCLSHARLAFDDTDRANVKARQGASTVDHSDLVEMVADDLTQSVSRMLVEMGSEDGERFARRALISLRSKH
jgi:hypothetical protein